MIRKECLTIILLFEDDEVAPEFFKEATLSDLERLMDDDEAVGLWMLESITAVRDADLQYELRALGDDGSFFELPEEEEQEEDEEEEED